MIKNNLYEIAQKLPNNPGVYQFVDEKGKIIYIGKAKNLRRRVLSYFRKNSTSLKMELLIKKSRDIKYIVVETETDAFLLENILIKKYKPKYNIQLKDDKTYPWIIIYKEPFPRIDYTRNINLKNVEYFGPFTSVQLVRSMLDFFRHTFKIRTCTLDLSFSKINENKYKPCLEYHLKNCLAPCIKRQTEEEYDRNIQNIRRILKGNITSVIKHLKQEMLSASEKLEFEKAQIIKEQIDLIKNYQSKSNVINPKYKDLDVFTIINSKNNAYINYLKVVEGQIIHAYSTELKKGLNEDLSDILAYSIVYILETKFFSLNKTKEILVPFEINLNIPDVKITVPKKGDKKKLIDLSFKNLEYYIKTKKNSDKYENKLFEGLKEMKDKLKLKNIPYHIEGFDNSHIQGKNNVSVCVVFKDGRPYKKEYRKFIIKTIDKNDDYFAMREVIFRRYKRLVQEKKHLPDLIIIDGGKGQLNAAIESLKLLNIYEQIDIIAIAKKYDLIYKPDDIYPYSLKKDSFTLKLIQRIRDESHRFAVTFHRKKRMNDMLDSKILKIHGIGEKTYHKLLLHFKTEENIINSSQNELAKVIGNKRAKLIFEYFNKERNEKQKNK